MAQLIELVTPQEYLDLIQVKATANTMEDLYELRDQGIINENLWDYPMDEYNDVVIDCDTNQIKDNVQDHYIIVLGETMRIWEI